jgi:S1-C subfamily serine protease
VRARRSFLAALALLAPAGSGAEPAPEPAFAALEQRIIEVAQRVKPSVVHIESVVRIDDRRNVVTGSGVIADSNGLILTNHHVVDRAEKVTIAIPGQRRSYPARVIGADMQTDIAVLRIEAGPPLVPAAFGRTEDVRVGQWVLAIGNPYGLDGTVSFGIVSAIGRNLELPETLNAFIQTDAMIDQGSSGGPLVDLEGRVIGINSRGQGRGIGFTIPIDTALEVARALEAGGVERGYLGISMQPLDRDLADYLGQPDLTGAVVTSVAQDSPAAKAGLRVGDILTRFDGTQVESEKDEDLGAFQRLVANVEPGREVAVAVLRDGKPLALQARIGTQPRVEPAEAETDVGFHVQEITANLARAFRLEDDRGAFVHFVARGSPAAEAGLFIGDVVRRIENQPVDDLDDFRHAMQQVAGRSRFLVTARRGDETRLFLVQRGGADAEPTRPAPDEASLTDR